MQEAVDENVKKTKIIKSFVTTVITQENVGVLHIVYVI